MREAVVDFRRLPVVVRMVAGGVLKRGSGHDPEEWVAVVEDMGARLSGGNVTRKDASAYVAELKRLDSFVEKETPQVNRIGDQAALNQALARIARARTIIAELTKELEKEYA